ncbi:hypothetical protein ACFQS3_25050 [Glycomyces mayteni]|uniref:Uncharacterized protein n=1 Tax=Glycomyces mayteni TaxID=543887 RepID=A0ABW2DGY1_9ACTN|nr:hypothetical protein GCM10025732_58450 [Glycomyces mayteni]
MERHHASLDEGTRAAPTRADHGPSTRRDDASTPAALAAGGSRLMGAGGQRSASPLRPRTAAPAVRASFGEAG